MKNDLVVLRRRKQKLQKNNSKMSAALNQHFFSEMVVDLVHNKDETESKENVTDEKIKSPLNEYPFTIRIKKTHSICNF